MTGRHTYRVYPTGALFTRDDAARVSRETALTRDDLTQLLDDYTGHRLDYLQLNLITSWVEEARRQWRKPDAA